MLPLPFCSPVPDSARGKGEQKGSGSQRLAEERLDGGQSAPQYFVSKSGATKERTYLASLTV